MNWVWNLDNRPNDALGNAAKQSTKWEPYERNMVIIIRNYKDNLMRDASQGVRISPFVNEFCYAINRTSIIQYEGSLRDNWIVFIDTNQS